MLVNRTAILAILVATAACSRSRVDDTRSTDQTETRSGNMPVETTTTTNANTNTDTNTKAKTTDAPKAKDPMKEADGDMKKVLEEMQSLGAKPVESLSIADARKQPTPADAVKGVLKKEGKADTPIAMQKVENRKIDGPGGKLDVRIYTPKVDAKTKKPLPVVTYFHGGGFAIANNDVYDSSAREIANQSHAIVVAADYRHAPEAKFPAAHDDAFAAYQWVLANAQSFGGDPKRVAVAGESAGGNLALNVSIMARDKHIEMPKAQLLIYPVATTGMNTESYSEWAYAKPLDKQSMAWFMEKYVRTPADANDPRLNLVNAKLDGLPPTTIILAQIDPLRSDGEILAKKLDAAGVKVDKKVYDGVTHEFFGMTPVVSDAKDAAEYAGDKLQASLK